jgi:CheY-like chemotaxis protein
MGDSIVLVDDFSVTLDFIQFHLETAGFNDIQKFECPFGALRYLKRGVKPSLIVTDYQMPGMNGIEFLREVDFYCGTIPSLIATCDHLSIESISKSYTVLDKGSTDFIPQLLYTIKKLVGNHLLKV